MFIFLLSSGFIPLCKQQAWDYLIFFVFVKTCCVTYYIVYFEKSPWAV
jgi:hypothetical protein